MGEWGPIREWLTPRLIGVGLTLVVGPLAALAQLAIAWYPQTARVARLDRQVADRVRTLDAECAALARLRDQLLNLEQTLADERRQAPQSWLPARDRDGVFDRIAAAVQTARVVVEELAAGEPTLFGALSRAHLLASERIVIRCTGDYAALTALIDRIAALDLPLTLRELSWERTGEVQSLRLVVLVPFVPDDALRLRLAETAALPREGP